MNQPKEKPMKISLREIVLWQRNEVKLNLYKQIHGRFDDWEETGAEFEQGKGQTSVTFTNKITKKELKFSINQ